MQSSLLLSSLSHIDWRLNTLSGIGPKTLDTFQQAGIKNAWQLVCLLPKYYEDHTTLHAPSAWEQALSATNGVLIQGVITKTWQAFFSGRRMFYCQLDIEGHRCRLAFFRLHGSAQKQFAIGRSIRCYGKLNQKNNTWTLYQPRYWLVAADTPLASHLYPIYPTVGAITQHRLRKAIEQVLLLLPHTDDHDASIMTPAKALSILHHPRQIDLESLTGAPSNFDRARKCIAMEEARAWVSYLQHAEQKHVQTTQAIACAKPVCDFMQVKQQLAFELTADQSQAITAISAELETNRPMMRLLQGDVGCGKTVVAWCVMWQVLMQGKQVVLLAPTQILAQQHFNTLKPFLDAFNISAALYSAANSTQDGKRLCEQMATAELRCVIATHAILQPSISFQQLAFVVVDEQHRFGVNQRQAIIDKAPAGFQAHCLLMSATPIPRSLAKVCVGASSCSTIRQLPAGRAGIQTALMSQSKRVTLIERIAKQLQAGTQMYWVCPKVADKGSAKAQSVQQVFSELVQALAGVRVGLLHGQQSNEMKQSVMQQFMQQEIQCLVTTTVVEVGVHVDNASIMVIDSAQQFGLAQLHQLRGRVGRGSNTGYCVVLYDGHVSDESLQRLQYFSQCNDGFALAEHDLSMRGPGDVLGLAQSGAPVWRVLAWPADQSLLLSQIEVNPYDHSVKSKELLYKLWGYASKASV